MIITEDLSLSNSMAKGMSCKLRSVTEEEEEKEEEEDSGEEMLELRRGDLINT